MEKEVTFAIISTWLYIIWAIPYWKDVFKWRTIPHVFSVFVWLILVWFNCYVLWLNKEWLWFIPSILMAISLLFGVIYWIKLFKQVLINWFDYLCLWLAGWLLVYYFFSGNITNTVVLSMIIDFVAFLPTFKKWWLQPWTESILIYFLAWINQIFTLLALSSPNFETSLFWIYIFFANLIFFFMVAIRRWHLKWWNSIFE